MVFFRQAILLVFRSLQSQPWTIMTLFAFFVQGNDRKLPSKKSRPVPSPFQFIYITILSHSEPMSVAAEVTLRNLRTSRRELSCRQLGHLVNISGAKLFLGPDIKESETVLKLRRGLRTLLFYIECWNSLPSYNMYIQGCVCIHASKSTTCSKYKFRDQTFILPRVRGAGSWSDDWIYWHLIHISLDYRQLQRYRYSHTLQFTVTHALSIPVFTSRILATALQQSAT
jgi:hypothetical protein